VAALAAPAAALAAASADDAAELAALTAADASDADVLAGGVTTTVEGVVLDGVVVLDVAGGVTTVSSRLLQPANATAATIETNNRAFFILVSSLQLGANQTIPESQEPSSRRAPSLKGNERSLFHAWHVIIRKLGAFPRA
jgi:hypothetical protein